MDSATTTLPPPKRGPGRPRKAPATPPPEKRPRGRPRLTDEEKLWRRYLVNRDNLQARNAVAQQYIPQVRRAAEKLMAVRQKLITVDELVGYGFEGLLQALRTFDPERGLKFMTFAAPRVMGAMLDGLRSMDEVPRLDRSRITRVLAIAEELEQRHGRRPTADELLIIVQERQLNITVDCIDKALGGGLNKLSISNVPTDAENGHNDVNKPQPFGASLVDRQATPHRRLYRAEFLDRIFAGLSYEERILLYLYHICGKTMKFVGEALDVSESRVSQLHGRLVERLRAKHKPEDLFGLLRE